MRPRNDNNAALALALTVSFACSCGFAQAQDSPPTAEQLANAALTYYQSGHPDSALNYLLRALDLLHSQGRQAEEAKTLINLGLMYENVGQPVKAVSSYQNALGFWKTTGDHALQAHTLNAIALTYGRYGQRDSALTYFRSALPIWSALSDAEREAETLVSIGGVFLDTGKTDSAALYFKSALDIQRAAQNRAGEAATFNRLGMLYALTGRRDSALAYYRAALPVHHSAGDTVEEATSLDGLALVYGQLGLRDSALVYYRTALPLWRSLHHEEGEAKVLASMAVIFAQIGQPDSGFAYYAASLKISLASGRIPVAGRTMVNVAGLLAASGQLDSALRYYRTGIALERRAGDRVGEGIGLGGIGAIYQRMQKRDSATVYYAEALQLFRSVHDRQNAAKVLSNLADFYAAGGTEAENRARSLAYYDSAAAIFASLRSMSGGDINAIAFAEVERETFQNWALAALQFRDVVGGTGKEMVAALAVAELGRAQGLRDLLSQRPTSRPQLSGLAVTDTMPGRDLFADAVAALTPIRKLHTAMLYYLIAGDSLYLWILDPSSEIRLMKIRSLPPDSLANLIMTVRRSVGADKARGGMVSGVGVAGVAREQELAGFTRGVDDEEPDPAAVEFAVRRLSLNLIPDDLVQRLAAGSEILIVPHGILSLVPFAALRAPGDTVPLGIRFALRYSPSLRALAADTPAANVGTDLVVGDPDMPTVTNAAGARVTLRDLPAAREEGAAVGRRLAVDALTGTSATETRIRDELSRARFAHFATHGYAFGTQARVRDSYIALAPDAHNDGLLTIGELLDDPRPLFADLVVLSACQTGLGDLKQTEGTVGFQRAFLAKGARSVLVSLWSVDDRATAMLMDRFYSHWLGADRRPAMTKAEALREAQADVRAMKAYASPKYWAAFQLVGAQ